MKVVNFISLVDKDKCTGDRHCERACPAGAIKVVKKKAGVDETRCVACGKCVEVCREGAITMSPRPQPLIIGVNVEEVDQGKIMEICRKARCFPDQLICPCSGTSARETAAAIVNGAKSPEDIVVMTGAGSGCGIYCMGIIFTMFKAAGIEIPEDPRWYNLPVSMWDIPDEVADRYPHHYINEDKKAFSP